MPFASIQVRLLHRIIARNGRKKNLVVDRLSPLPFVRTPHHSPTTFTTPISPPTNKSKFKLNNSFKNHNNYTRRAGLVGSKQGMVTFWDAFGKMRPVSVIKVKDNQVIHSRFEPQINSWMVKVGGFDFEDIKTCRKSMLMTFRKYLIPPKRKIIEFTVSEDCLIAGGVHLNVAHFVPGQFVDIQGITKGKGFQGPMKRWGFSGQPASHGVSLAHRSGGSIGQSTSPGRVFKGRKMAGRMGGDLQTTQSLQVLKVDPHENLIYVSGSIPGPKGAYVRIIDAKKKLERKCCFPKDSVIPMPTFLGNISELPSEMVMKLPTDKEELLRDPLLKVVGEPH